MLPRLRFFFEQAVLGLWRSLGITALAVVTIGVALGLLATFAVVVANLARVADTMGQDVEIAAYLSPTTTATIGQARAVDVARWPEIQRSRFLTSTQAMDAFRLALGSDAAILEGLPADVMPPTLELQLAPRAWRVVELESLAARLDALPGIDEVRYGQEDLERIHALLGFARVVAVVVAVVLCMAVILIVSNTIRLTVYARRDEIEIMSLIGGTDAFIRAPFLIEGAIQGVAGGLVAALGLVVLQGVLEAGIKQGLSYAYGPIELEFMPFPFVGGLLALGVLLGLIGSLLAVGKFVKV
jgi:cell division transport system permease protein